MKLSKYKGYYYDVETGLFWLSSRYYSPELCRFISPDSVDYLDPSSINGLNLYACYISGEAVLVKFNDMNGNKVTEMQVIKGLSINEHIENENLN